MNNKETSSLINFHNLSIELRRLKPGNYTISTAALLINQSITQTKAKYSNLLQHPDSKNLTNLCKIICYRFSNDPSSEIINLVSLLRFSFGPQQIGPWFLLKTMFSIYLDNLNDNCLKVLNKFDPIFLEKFLLGEIYTNPKNLFNATSDELLLPLQIPILSNLSLGAGKSYSLLQYLIYYSLTRSYTNIFECATNEKLFESFSNFVYNNPQFFIVANQIFKKKQLIDILSKLKTKNPPNLLNSYLRVYYNTSHELIELFLNLYNENEMLNYVSDDNIEDLYNFFQSNNQWNSISLLYKRDEKSHSLLYSIFQSSFAEDQPKYLSRYSSTKCDFLIEAIEPIIINHQINIDPRYFINLLPNDQISLKMLQNNPHFLHIILESTPKREEVRKKTISQITSFLNRNLETIMRILNMSLHQHMFNEQSIINQLLVIDELTFFDIFDVPGKNQILTDAAIDFISFITQSMNQGMNPPPGTPIVGAATPPVIPSEIQQMQVMKFPSKRFFDILVQKVDVGFILINIYKMNQHLMMISEWRDALVAIPQLLFSTLDIQGQTQIIANSFELVNLFQKYITNNYDTFSKSAINFYPLVRFFLNKDLMMALPQFQFQNFSLSIRLSLLECFASCSHTIFANEPELDLRIVDSFVSFFNLLASTNVFSIDSPSNDLLCREFVLQLIRIPKYESLVPQMMIELNTSPPQPLTAISSTCSDAAQSPSIENLDVEIGSSVDPQSFQFIIEFLRSSMPDSQAIEHMIGQDIETLRKLTELSVKALSHTDCNLWIDPKFMNSLITIFDKLNEFNLTPMFLQALTYYLNMYCLRNDSGSRVHPDIHPELISYYQFLAEFSMKNKSFENVLMELLD